MRAELRAALHSTKLVAGFFTQVGVKETLIPPIPDHAEWRRCRRAGPAGAADTTKRCWISGCFYRGLHLLRYLSRTSSTGGRLTWNVLHRGARRGAAPRSVLHAPVLDLDAGPTTAHGTHQAGKQ